VVIAGRSGGEANQHFTEASEMGLFDKRKKGEDDYDSPVEQVSLSAKPAPAAPPTGRASGPATAVNPLVAPAGGLATAPPAPLPGIPPMPSQAPVAAAQAPAPAPRAIAPVEVDAPDFGINKAIELMRALPIDNVELVVQVVKKTLESLGVQVPTIIRDGERKLRDIEGRIDVLKREIGDLESEIATRRTEIGGLEADHKETSTVKERMELAEKMAKGGPAAAAGAVRQPPRPSDAYAAVQVKADPPRPPTAGSAVPTPIDPTKK
jgi:hypothetical protein